MITDSVTFDKEKNNLPLRSKIVEVVAKHSRSRNDVYDACRRATHLSRTEFCQLLETMHRDGEIYINQNGRVLPERPQTSVKINQTPQPPTQRKKPPEPDENHSSEILIHCLVNRSRSLKDPKEKKPLKKNGYYAHHNYKIERIPLDRVYEETLLRGFQFIPGEFRGNPNPDIGIRSSENWKSQQVFLIEFDNPPENTLDDFITERPFIRENAWLITESIRSKYDDPKDKKCNGQLRPRLILCMPCSVSSQDEREWIYEALVKELPGCDDGSAISIISGGLGRRDAPHIKIGKIVDRKWFDAAIATGQQAKQEKEADKQRAAAERQHRQAERAAMGFTERAGELPLEALAKSDPSLFLESIGLSWKSEKGKYQHYGRSEKRDDTALSIWLSAQGNYQIRVFANSIPVPPGVSGAMPFARFYCYHELSSDIEGLQPDSQQWKDLNAQLASQGYGTWLSDAEFRKAHTTPVGESKKSNNPPGITPVTSLPPDHRLLTSAPHTEVGETTSFPHFSKEERILLKSQGLDPDAGWNGATPIWTPKYEHLHPITGHFALNGQPPETERHRVWHTMFRRCECGGLRALNINRYTLVITEYCEKCHREFPITSYLKYELHRKVKHSITSECGGYLGNDPEYAYFCREMGLWSPGMITHLASAMNTGKTTEIVSAMRIFLVQHQMHRAILIVPRISLARFLGYQLRSIDGQKAWGIYHEGSGSNDFIGTHGAICCLPSLPRVMADAERYGLKPEHLLLAIDEVDFSYLLFEVIPSLTRKIKEGLRTAVNTNGLVTAGQTEFTLALERFTTEIGAPNGCQAFYKAADPCDNGVTIRITPDTENKHTAVIASTLRHIEDHFADGKNVYAFTTTRRDSHLIADAFKHLNPVVYNAYTKGAPRADAVLREQKVTDTPLFIGTSAASVGISIHDPIGVTEIMMKLIHGQLDLSSATQEGVRNRSRGDIGYNLVEYTLKLPVKPSETEKISLFHEKQKEILGGEKVNTESVKRAADVYALNSLADTHPETFLRYHFEEVVNMNVSVVTETTPQRPELNSVKVLRKESIEKERTSTAERAKEILVGVELMTCNEIRKAGNNGELVPIPEEQLSHEYANHALQAVGFDDKLPVFQTVGGIEIITPQRKETIERFAGKQQKIACALIDHAIDLRRLAKQRNGWLAVHCPDISRQIASENANKNVETTAFEYPVVHGAFLEALLSACNQHHTTESLSEAVLAVLNREYEDSRFYDLILKGALGLPIYRAVKFLKFAEPIDRVEFARQFISENYPSRIMKSEDAYALIQCKHEKLMLQSFQCWLEMNAYPIPDPLYCISGEPLPDPNAEKKERAREMRAKGALLSEIAADLEMAIGTISKYCRDIKTDRKAKKEEALKLHTLGVSRKEIATLLDIPYKTILRWLRLV